MIQSLEKEVRTGRVVRTVVHGAKNVSEHFSVLFDVAAPVDKYASWHGKSAVVIDVQQFFETPDFDVPLIYRRLLSSSADRGVVKELFESQRVVDPVKSAIVVNLSNQTPLAEVEFWNLIGDSTHVRFDDRTSYVVNTVASNSLEYVKAFSSTLFCALAELNSEEVSECPANNAPSIGGDSFLWWRLAVIFEGWETYKRVLSNESEVFITEESWAAGEDLVRVSELAYEKLVGQVPIFVGIGQESSGHGDELGTEIEENSSSSRIDYRGVREYQTMSAAGLSPTIIGSHYLVEDLHGLWELVAIQLVDVERENCGEVSRSLAEQAVSKVGGRIVSSVKFCDSHTTSLFNGLAVLEIYKSFVGDVDEYREAIGLL